MKKNILITGGAGFIGSNFIPYFAKKYPDYNIINLDLLTYAGDLDNLAEMGYARKTTYIDVCVENFMRRIFPYYDTGANYTFIKGDIRNRKLVNKIFETYDIKGVIHFAAESHVDNSIKNPDAFITTNINGTFELLNAAKNHWMTAPRKPRAGYEHSNFHHVSTDEVYGSLGDSGLFTETTAYDPSSPYSAAKASSDHIVNAYHRTFGMNVTISNCSNNYGPKQNVEKLIPKTITNALSGKEIPVYGAGANIRDWLYVLDHCKGIDRVFHIGNRGETYNIGGRNEKTNIEIVTNICGILDELNPRRGGGKYADLIKFVADRPGHDLRYAIDASKIERLGWKAEETFDTGIAKTVKWYLYQFLTNGR
ncbi:MAG: dTDP-glucose 4,6-dehydratase [Alphaproteobacteria bacterium]|nr:dTDP-glucose 4,6-dehydratase [Alphaproteobacteria bacterium]